MTKLVEEVYLMYPDISHIFAAKAQRRRMLAALSWEEKVTIIERMRSLTKDMWKGMAVDEDHRYLEPSNQQNESSGRTSWRILSP